MTVSMEVVRMAKSHPRKNQSERQIYLVTTLHIIGKFIIMMANSVSGKDEPNRSLLLVTREGKMELSSFFCAC